MKHEAIENIPDSVHKARVFSKAIDDDIIKVHSKLSNRVNKYRSARDEAAAELRRHETVLERLKKEKRTLEGSAQRMNTPELSSQIDELDETIFNKMRHTDMLEDNLDLVTMKYKKLNNAHIQLGKNPQQAIKNIQQDPLLAEDTDLMQYVREMELPISNKLQILNSTSRFIKNDKKFVEEYLTRIRPFKAKSGAESVYATNWMANPQNVRKLEELRSSRKLGKILQEAELYGKETREVIKDLKPGSIANKLKIGAGLAASIAAPMAIMSWFDGSSDKVQKETQYAKSTLGGFNVKGGAKKIFDNTQMAVNDAEDAIADAEKGLGGDDPGKAAEEYVNRLINDKQIIDQSLAQWNEVIKNSDNTQAATQAGNRLQALSVVIGTELSKAGKATKRTPIPGGLAGKKKVVSREQVKDIQRFLRDRSMFSQRFTSVAPSGILDRPTKRALKLLENEFNRSQKTNEFTNLLYNGQSGHLIEASDIEKIEKTLQRQ